MALVPFPTKGADRGDDSEPDWDDDEESDGGKMSFLEHLDELRRRLIYAISSVLGGFLIAIFFIDRLFNFVMLPMQAMLPVGQKLIYTDPTEAFTLYIKLALIAGLILASPAVMTQVWLFVAPGLYSHEKKWAIPFIVMSSVCFVAGAAFSHYIVFPLTWRFFIGFSSDILSAMPRVEPSFSIYMRMLLAFGVVFQIPTVVLFLARMGVITAGFMVRHIKYAVLGIIIISAIVTPDGGGVSLVAMAGPLILLYVFSIGLAWMFGKKKRIPDAA